MDRLVAYGGVGYNALAPETTTASRPPVVGLAPSLPAVVGLLLILRGPSSHPRNM
ncbi:MAG: hypothetical protein L6R38_004480 [Xanthoria sp. 2 TBL-2021]|nr:MAG: hypothetical protein L6R38_004480 [Xanthoria sp. 2 TBL-2021]